VIHPSKSFAKFVKESHVYLKTTKMKSPKFTASRICYVLWKKQTKRFTFE